MRSLLCCMRALPMLLVAAGAWLAPVAMSQTKPLALPGAVSMSHGGKTFLIAPYGAVQASAVWTKPGWTKNGDKPIPVCWERLADSDAGLRIAVRSAVEKSWGLYGMVSFPGWGECSSDSRGIRIGIDKEDSLTYPLGRHLDGVPNGMKLRMDFTEFKECANRNEFCVTATAVHEFGHALGLTHEQNRPDTPDWCKSKKLKSGTLPDQKITVWDPQSIMNYCNKDWMESVGLSPLDIVTVTILYGARA